MLTVMTTKPVNLIAALALSVGPYPPSSAAASSTLETVTVCDLAHFGPSKDRLTFRVRGIYLTDFRHGSQLYDPNDKACFIEFGVKQSDVDGSVERFQQAVVDAVMRLGPGTPQLVDAEVVFHWVTSQSGLPGRRAHTPAGALEFRRVFQTETKSRSSE